jgi:hypothetical protein
MTFETDYSCPACGSNQVRLMIRKAGTDADAHLIQRYSARGHDLSSGAEQ